MATKIEWTDVTDNIIVVEGGGWWCRRISPGCDHCYAETLNQNTFFGGNKLPYRGAPPVLKLRQEIIDGWARQRKPKRHFVSSMTDVFGEWVSNWMIFQMLDGMKAAPTQTFQVLTKRPEVMAAQTKAWLDQRGLDFLPANIWLGMTVENQEWATRRREVFKAIPARIKFVSYEPVLGPVDWTGWEFVDQIICGGESGPGARVSHPDWHRTARDWCIENRKAFFFKQWGRWWPGYPVYGDTDSVEHFEDLVSHPNYKYKEKVETCMDNLGIEWNDSQPDPQHNPWWFLDVGKKAAGRLLDGREWNQMPDTETCRSPKLDPTSLFKPLTC